MMDDTFFQQWMVLGQHWKFAQYRSRLPHDKTHKTQRHAKIKQVHVNFIGKSTAKDHLVKIKPVPEYQ